MTQKAPSVLLPKHITPVHYSIYLEPDLDNFVFTGEEKIQIDVSKAVTQITLHSAELEVLTAKIIRGKSEEVARKITYNKKAETATFDFSKIAKGKLILVLTFAGILNDKMRGFYRSRYTHNGKTYHMGVTQFESTDARRAFPCFDEPARKATFDVSLKVPSDRTVISNTLEEEVIEHEGGFKVVRFEKSPKMSSYLLAFVVGHFDYVETTTPEGVKVRVYVTPGKKKQAEFALETAGKIMSFYHNYFGIAYPLPTMDLIAIPDFANGAMENWGAVTYRETALLVDPDNSSLHTKQWVALVIAHELAHQWFGNLVTMKWWTHLWLNEGFASFIEYLAVDKLFPKWNVWTQFVYTEQAKAFLLDGLLNTHPIEILVHHPGEIGEIFDAVSYSKGASIIRMIESYVGEGNFRKGLQLYLRTHKYSNAETKDLWAALEKVSNKPVGKIMKNWTSKPGYPVVTITKNKGAFVFHQERFVLSPQKKDTSKESWLIPMSVVSDNKRKIHSFLIDKKSVAVKGFFKSKWIKGNVGDTSFVRIKYAPKILRELEYPVRNRDLSLGEEGRFALIRDLFALVEAGQVEIHDVLEFVNFYKKENSYIVWAEIITHLLEFKYLIFGSLIEGSYAKYCMHVLKEIADEVGWKKGRNETHERTLLRSLVLYAVGTFQDKKTIACARKIFADIKIGEKVDSDLRSIAYILVAENGNENDFKDILKIYKTSDSEEEKDRALRAICSFGGKKYLKKALQVAFSKDVRAQDAYKAVFFLSQNPNGIDLAWDYVVKNWNEIINRFAGGHLFARFISPFAKFKTFEKADEVEEFFKKNKASGIERTVAQTLEKIRSNVNFIERDLPGIELFFKN